MIGRFIEQNISASKGDMERAMYLPVKYFRRNKCMCLYKLSDAKPNEANSLNIILIMTDMVIISAGRCFHDNMDVTHFQG